MTQIPPIEDLVGRMLRTTYFVVSGRTVGDPAVAAGHLRAHLLYMIDLEKQGVLLAGGPFVNAQGVPGGDGMSILRAEDESHALALAMADPMVVAGCREVSVRRWMVNEGSVSVTVHFSDGSGRPA